MSSFGVVLSCITVSLLWGLSNPLIRSCGLEMPKVRRGLLSDCKYFLTNWKSVLPILVNQSGSVVFYFTLQNAPLSLVVPLTNALTFGITGLAGFYCGDAKPDLRTVCGIIFILFGITLCVLDKANQ